MGAHLLLIRYVLKTLHVRPTEDVLFRKDGVDSEGEIDDTSQTYNDLMKFKNKSQSLALKWGKIYTIYNLFFTSSFSRDGSVHTYILGAVAPHSVGPYKCKSVTMSLKIFHHHTQP